MLLKASESFVKQYSVENQNVRQLDVMLWLLKNDYKPASDSDSERLDMVIKVYVFEKEVIYSLLMFQNRIESILMKRNLKKLLAFLL